MLNFNSELKVSQVFLCPKANLVKEECMGRVFSTENFASSWDSIYVRPEELEINKVEKGMRRITIPTAVITSHSNQMAFLLASNENPIYLPNAYNYSKEGYILAFRLTPLISPEFLYYMCQYDLWSRFASQFREENNDGFGMDWSYVGQTTFEASTGDKIETEPFTVIYNGFISLPSIEEQKNLIEAAKNQEEKIQEMILPEYEVEDLVSWYLFEARKKNIFSSSGLGLIAKVYKLAANDNADTRVIEILSQYEFQEGILSEEELIFLSRHLNDVFNEVLDFGDIKKESTPGFIQPQEVTDFVCEMAVFPEDIAVYNPFAGANSYALALPNKVVGEELDPLTWALGQIRIFANDDIERVHITLADSFNRMRDEEKFLGIVCSPAYMREKGCQIEDVVHLLYNKLENGGKLACLVPGNFLYGNSKYLLSLREMLIKNKAISKVLMLPANIFTGTSIPQAVIIITKGIPNKEIIFGDASGYIKYEKSAYRATTFDLNTYIEDYLEDTSNIYVFDNISGEPEEDSIALRVNYSKITSSNLNPAYYLTPRPKNGTPLSELAEEIPELRGQNQKAEYFITGSSIPAAMHRKPYFPGITNDGNLSTSKSQIMVPENAVIIALVSGKIRTVYTENFSSVIAFPYGFIKIIKPKEGVSAKYLAAVISTKEVAAQIIAQTSVLTLPRLNRIDMTQIIIPQHKTIEEQEKLISEVLSSEMSDLESELQITLDNHKREVRSTRHAMIQTLSALSSKWEKFKMFADSKNGVINLNDTIGRINPTSVKDFMVGIQYAISTLQRQVDSFSFEKNDWGEIVRINPFEFIETYIHTHPTTEFTLQNLGRSNEADIPNFSEENDAEHSFHTNALFTFKAPRAMVERIFDNIVSNAKAHGFTSETINPTIQFDWETLDGSIVITIKNNGSPLLEGVSGADVLMSDFSTALKKEANDGSLHYGIGGFEIKSLMEDFGSVEVISQPDAEFPVIYRLTFNDVNFTDINLDDNN